MKNLAGYLGGILIIIAIAGYFVFSTGSAQASNIPLNGEVQIVKLSVVGGNYVLEPSEVKIGIPVRIEGDIPKMPGCSKSIVISAFNIRKTMNSGDNLIEFTPDKSGTFNIACSMNMYKGTFSVLENDGSKSNYVDKQLSAGSSCGTSGGCGCGS